MRINESAERNWNGCCDVHFVLTLDPTNVVMCILYLRWIQQMLWCAFCIYVRSNKCCDVHFVFTFDPTNVVMCILYLRWIQQMLWCTFCSYVGSNKCCDVHFVLTLDPTNASCICGIKVIFSIINLHPFSQCKHSAFKSLSSLWFDMRSICHILCNITHSCRSYKWHRQC